MTINHNERRIKNGDVYTESGARYKEVSNFRRAIPQFLVVGVKNCILLGWGFILGYPTIIIPALQAASASGEGGFNLTDEEVSWISSINLLCVPFGSLVSGLLTEPFGKRRIMQCLNIPMVFAWGLFYFSTNIYHVYIALGLAGMSGGLLEAPLLTYIAETVQPQYRGMLTAVGTATVIGGVCFQFIIGSFLHWKTVAAFSAISPTIAFLVVFFVPETPYWLLKNDRVEDAHKSLQWLRGWVPFGNVEKEFEQITYAIERDRQQKKELSTDNQSFMQRAVPFGKRSFVAPFLLIVAAFFIGHFSGMTPLQTYAIQIFVTLKAPINEYYATISLGAAETLGCIVGAIFIRSTGKRPLVFASLIGNGLCFFGAALYSYYAFTAPGIVTEASSQSNILNSSEMMASHFMPSLSDNFDIVDSSRAVRSLYHIHVNELPSILTDESGVSSRIIEDALHQINPQNYSLSIVREEKNNEVWIPSILLVLGSLFAHMGIKMIPWMLIGEVYPTTVRGTAAGLSSTIGYLSAFVANKVFLDMVRLLTMPGTFFVYSCVAIVGVIFLYFKLPETENRTLLEIEANFDKTKREYLKQQKMQQQQPTQQPQTLAASNEIDSRQTEVAIVSETTRH